MINGNSDPNLCLGSGEYISDYSGFVLVRFILCLFAEENDEFTFT